MLQISMSDAADHAALMEAKRFPACFEVFSFRILNAMHPQERAAPEAAKESRGEVGKERGPKREF